MNVIQKFYKIILTCAEIPVYIYICMNLVNFGILSRHRKCGPLFLHTHSHHRIALDHSV